jgi:hypothetical protein
MSEWKVKFSKREKRIIYAESPAGDMNIVSGRGFCI